MLLFSFLLVPWVLLWSPQMACQFLERTQLDSAGAAHGPCLVVVGNHRAVTRTWTQLAFPRSRPRFQASPDLSPVLSPCVAAVTPLGPFCSLSVCSVLPGPKGGMTASVLPGM